MLGKCQQADGHLSQRETTQNDAWVHNSGVRDGSVQRAGTRRPQQKQRLSKICKQTKGKSAWAAWMGSEEKGWDRG